MEASNARLARRFKCAMCCHFKRTVTVDGPQVFGLCVQSPPRTSSVKWPAVFADKDWCGAWEPVVDLEVH